MTVYRRSSLCQEKERLESANMRLRQEIENLSGLYGREVVENSLLRKQLSHAEKIIAFWKRVVKTGTLGFGYSAACATLLSFASPAGSTLDKPGQGGADTCSLPTDIHDADPDDTDRPATPMHGCECAILSSSLRFAIESALDMRLDCAQVTLIWPANNAS